MEFSATLALVFSRGTWSADMSVELTQAIVELETGESGYRDMWKMEAYPVGTYLGALTRRAAGLRPARAGAAGRGPQPRGSDADLRGVREHHGHRERFEVGAWIDGEWHEFGPFINE